MFAHYKAISKDSSSYRIDINKKLVDDQRIDNSNVLWFSRTPEYEGISIQMILLGLQNDSLLLKLTVYSPELKSLDEI